MADEVTFTKQKANGTVQKRKVRGDRYGDWKEWLKFLVRLKEHADFMGYSRNDDDQENFLEDLRSLLFGDDLQTLNMILNQTTFVTMEEGILRGLRTLTAYHCPPGTREALIADLKRLKKTKAMTVMQYSQLFREHLRMLPYLEHGENEMLPAVDQVQIFRKSMPLEWQCEAMRFSRTWPDIGDLERKFTLIERNEAEMNELRSQRPQSQRSNESHGKRGKETNRDSNDRPKKECAYCKANNGAYTTHNDNECFRNPKSPKYKERTNTNKPPRFAASNGSSKLEKQVSELAAMVSAMRRERDEERAAMEFYGRSSTDMSEMAACTVEPTVPAGAMRVNVEVIHGSKKKVVSGLIDTGCTHSVVDQSLLDQTLPVEGSRQPYRRVDGSEGLTAGVTTIGLKLPDFSDKRSCAQEVQVSEKLLYPVILGVDFLWSQRFLVDFNRRVLEWDDVVVKMEERASAVAAFAVADDEIDSRADRLMSAAVPAVSLDDIATPALSADQRVKFGYMILPFTKDFSEAIGDIKLPPYEIPLKPDAKPFAARPYPIPQALLPATKAEVDRLVKLGVLEPDDSSEWAAPSFVIPKKDGRVRLVTDFRGLNEQVRRQYFPLPRIPDMLRTLPKPRYMSSLDNLMAYYARWLALISRPCTATVFPFGKYRYVRLPMGVATAPDEFQRVMLHFFGDLQYVRIYLDDILIVSDTFEDHLQHIAVVLERMRDAGMIVNLAKSHFFAETIDYLGFRLSANGIEPMPNKVDAILQLESPRTRRQLRRFVGMVNYYRDLLPRRAELLAPLTNLTSPSVPFRWTSVAEVAFQTVKQLIAQRTRIAYPDYSLPFEVYTDASQYQMGGVICQQGRPIAFWSKKCSPTQRQYPANKLELLSVVELLREFRVTLFGQGITIFTDHQNLTFQNFNNAQMLRWRMEVEEFGPRIRYIKGSTNVVADALSRLDLKQQQPIVEAAAAATPVPRANDELFSLSLTSIAAAQDSIRNDPGLVENEVGGVQVLVQRETKRIAVPPSLTSALVNTYHSWLMHPGSSAMAATIGQVFYWPKMDDDIRNAVAQCHTCAMAKRPTTKYGHLPAKTVEVRPWFEIAVDSIGPFGPQKFMAISVIDTSTRLMELAPVVDGSSAEAARLIDQLWFCKYPRPVRCIYDQGSEFLVPCDRRRRKAPPVPQ